MSSNETQRMTASRDYAASCHTGQRVLNSLRNSSLRSECRTKRCSSNHKPNLSSQRPVTGRMLMQDKEFR